MTTFAPSPKLAVETASPDFTLLHDMLCHMRPDKSRTEQRFVDKYLAPLGAEPDAAGNMILRIGTAPVLWSCHTDTVHHQGGFTPIRVDEEKGKIDVHPKSSANCLGADDTAGIWLMMNMIWAKRPGLYIFHRGEECGGIGSKWLTKNTPDLVKGIKYAIAFDRKGKDSIITHQWGGRCCSEAFSKSMAAELNLGMKSDSTGSFTDTANYTDLIGECTNLSVGYYAQHSRHEELDQSFLGRLLYRLLVLDVDKLVSARKPGEQESKYSGGSAYAGYTNWRGRHDKTKQDNKKDKKPEPIYRWRGGKVVEETFLTLVEDYPEELAKMLEDSHYDLEFLRAAIRKRGGVLIDTADMH